MESQQAISNFKSSCKALVDTIPPGHHLTDAQELIVLSHLQVVESAIRASHIQQSIALSNPNVSGTENNPYIWEPADKQTLTALIMAKENGTHIEQYKGRWYVFEVSEDLLRWCRVLTKKEADTFYRQFLNTPRG
jgi:hypothetical protein